MPKREGNKSMIEEGFWYEEIVEALNFYNGKARYSQICDYIERNTSRVLPKYWENIVGKTLGNNSRGRGRDLFAKLERGLWALKSIIEGGPIIYNQEIVNKKIRIEKVLKDERVNIFAMTDGSTRLNGKCFLFLAKTTSMESLSNAKFLLYPNKGNQGECKKYGDPSNEVLEYFKEIERKIYKPQFIAEIYRSINITDRGRENIKIIFDNLKKSSYTLWNYTNYDYFFYNPKRKRHTQYIIIFKVSKINVSEGIMRKIDTELEGRRGKGRAILDLKTPIDYNKISESEPVCPDFEDKVRNLESLINNSALEEDDRDNTEFQERVQKALPSQLTKDVIVPIPVPETISTSPGEKLQKKPAISKEAIINAKYTCEKCSNSNVFISKKTNENYVEAHHLIPFTKTIQLHFNNSLDVPENIIALCPNCHRFMHYGKLEEIIKDLKTFLEKRKELLRKRGIDTTLERLVEYYK